MSDTKLRDLERRWKETGAVEDEAAYLLERVRVGELTRERLELAAYCGHEAACTLATVQSESDLMQWVVGLHRWGIEALVRAAIAAYRVQLWRGIAVHYSPRRPSTASPSSGTPSTSSRADRAAAAKNCAEVASSSWCRQVA